jgi:hypothetical protein
MDICLECLWVMVKRAMAAGPGGVGSSIISTMMEYGHEENYE